MNFFGGNLTVELLQFPTTYIRVWPPPKSMSGKAFSQIMRVWSCFDCHKKMCVFGPQPPPQIYDKQLDEREHTIEEWKGDCAVFMCTLCLPGIMI